MFIDAIRSPYDLEFLSDEADVIVLVVTIVKTQNMINFKSKENILHFAEMKTENHGLGH